MKTFLYLIRRELWEFPSLWMAPVLAAALLVVALCASLFITNTWTGTVTVREIERLDRQGLQERMEGIRRDTERLGELRGQLAAKTFAGADQVSAGMSSTDQADRIRIQQDLDHQVGVLADQSVELLRALLGKEGIPALVLAELDRELAQLDRELASEPPAVAKPPDAAAPATPEPPPAPADPDQLEKQFEQRVERAATAIAISSLQLARDSLQASGQLGEEIAAELERELANLRAEMDGSQSLTAAPPGTTDQDSAMPAQPALEERKRDLQADVQALRQQIAEQTETLAMRQDELNQALADKPGSSGQVLHSDGKPSLRSIAATWADLDPAKRKPILQVSFMGVTLLIYFLVTAWVAFYAYAATSEARDRSILFWKSLPISDAQSLLAKLCTMGLVAFAVAMLVTIATQLVVAGLLTGVLGHFGHSALELVWQPFLAASDWGGMGARYLITSLFLLPYFGWILLVGLLPGRRWIMLTVLNPVTLGLLERWLFGSSLILDGFEAWLQSYSEMLAQGAGAELHRLSPGTPAVFIDPSRVESFDVLAHPALWVGAALGVILLQLAIWTRRYRDETA